MLKKFYLELWPGRCSIDEVEVVEVEVEDGELFYRFYDLGDPPIDGGDMRRFGRDAEGWLQRFEELNIHRWRKEYADFVDDGLCWTLEYQKERWKITRHFHGCGAFPENWEEFTKLLDELRQYQE